MAVHTCLDSVPVSQCEEEDGKEVVRDSCDDHLC